MNSYAEMPLWAAITIAVLAIIGSTLTLLGAWGLLRLGSFYDRLHAPTLGTSWGAFSVILASALLATYIEGRLIVHELVIGVALLITMPVTLMLLSRATLHRDRDEKSPELPPEVIAGLAKVDQEVEEQKKDEEEKKAKAE